LSRETKQLVRVRAIGPGNPKFEAAKLDLPPAKAPPAWDFQPLAFPDTPEGSLERPGYKAIAYPRPKTVSGEDRIMPGAVAALPNGIADTYDMAYGLARDKDGNFVFGYAPYADAKMPGAGGALRLKPGKPPEEVAFGMRNPLGWCAGTDGEVFFTDNQGDWVA